MRNILEKVRRRNQAKVRPRLRKSIWRRMPPRHKSPSKVFAFAGVRGIPPWPGRFEQDLPELRHFFALSPHLEVRRRTRTMVVFSKVESVERIICAIFSRFNEDWKNHTLHLYQQLDVTNDVKRICLLQMTLLK